MHRVESHGFRSRQIETRETHQHTNNIRGCGYFATCSHRWSDILRYHCNSCRTGGQPKWCTYIFIYIRTIANRPDAERRVSLAIINHNHKNCCHLSNSYADVELVTSSAKARAIVQSSTQTYIHVCIFSSRSEEEMIVALSGCSYFPVQQICETYIYIWTSKCDCIGLFICVAVCVCVLPFMNSLENV